MRYYDDWGSIAFQIDVNVNEISDKRYVYQQIGEQGFVNVASEAVYDYGKKMAAFLDDVKLVGECTLELEGLTEHSHFAASVRYAKWRRQGEDMIVFSYQKHATNLILLPLALEYEGELVASEEVEFPLRLTPKSFLVITFEEFQKRVIHTVLDGITLKTKVPLSEKIKNSTEFKTLFKKVHESDENIFITGYAGTGKSSFLRYYIHYTDKSWAIVAPTGVAAINVGGATVHSFFKIPPHALDISSFTIPRHKKYKNLELLIIDEVSMLRADLFDTIDLILRKNKNNDLPFGGIKVVLFGDLYQIPPIIGSDPILRQYFRENYPSEWFFGSRVFARMNLEIYSLDKSYRQKDQSFIDLLNKIRVGDSSNDVLRAINTRFTAELSSGQKAITLTTTNATADKINKDQLKMNSSKIYEYNGRFTNQFNRAHLPVNPTLQLKVGAQVMLVKNDQANRWVNGTIGVVSTLTENQIEVEIGGSVYEVERQEWENIGYEYDRKTKKLKPVVLGTYQQYPLKLAWAITIHKSQGKTFENLILDLGSGAFVAGQVYVALSRCPSLSGIYLNQKIKQSDVFCDDRVSAFQAQTE